MTVSRFGFSILILIDFYLDLFYCTVPSDWSEMPSGILMGPDFENRIQRPRVERIYTSDRKPRGPGSIYSFPITAKNGMEYSKPEQASER